MPVQGWAPGAAGQVLQHVAPRGPYRDQHSSTAPETLAHAGGHSIAYPARLKPSTQAAAPSPGGPPAFRLHAGRSAPQNPGQGEEEEGNGKQQGSIHRCTGPDTESEATAARPQPGHGRLPEPGCSVRDLFICLLNFS